MGAYLVQCKGTVRATLLSGCEKQFYPEFITIFGPVDFGWHVNLSFWPTPFLWWFALLTKQQCRTQPVWVPHSAHALSTGGFFRANFATKTEWLCTYLQAAISATDLLGLSELLPILWDLIWTSSSNYAYCFIGCLLSCNSIKLDWCSSALTDVCGFSVVLISFNSI